MVRQSNEMKLRKKGSDLPGFIQHYAWQGSVTRLGPGHKTASVLQGQKWDSEYQAAALKYGVGFGSPKAGQSGVPLCL